MARKKSRREAGSGSISKRPDGRWQGQYTNGQDPKTGKLRRHTIYGKTQKEVAEKLRAITAAIDKNTYQEPNKITLQEYAEEYLNNYAGNLSPYTQQSYCISLENHILPVLGGVKLTNLTHREIQAFITSLGANGKGLSPKTIRNIHGVLHSILSATVRDEILLRNVSEQCKLPRVTQKQIKAITAAELSTFLAAIKDEPFRNIFFVDIFSGLRQVEILGLSWDDIDWANHCIYVRNQLQQRQVKEDFGYYLAPPKEGKERSIVLAASAMQVLREQQALQERMHKIATLVWDNPWNLVFTNDFGKPLNRRTVYKHLKRLLSFCGMGNRSFHSLRHSFATICLENGDDIKTVQTNLGHYAASFTLKTYAHVSDRMQQNSTTRMDTLIRSLPER